MSYLVSSYIPDKNKEMVYNSIKNKTLAEFEATLRDGYEASNKPFTTTQPGSYIRDTIMPNSQNN